MAAPAADPVAPFPVVPVLPGHPVARGLALARPPPGVARERRGYRPPRLRVRHRLRPQPGPQPVHVGQDLPPERPLAAADGVGGARFEQRRQFVLLLVGGGELLGQLRLQRPGVRREHLHHAPVGADRLGQVAEHVRQPDPGRLVPHRRALAVDAGAVQDRPGQAAGRHRGVFERLQPAAQRDFGDQQVVGDRVEPGPAEPAAGVEPDAVGRLPQGVLHPLDFVAQRPGPQQPPVHLGGAGDAGGPVTRCAIAGAVAAAGAVASRAVSATGGRVSRGQVGRHLGEQLGQLARQRADGLTGRLHPWGAEDQPPGQPGRGADQRVDHPPGGGGVRAGRGEDQHGRDRDLEQVVPEAQHAAGDQRPGDDEGELPPGEADDLGHADGDQHAGRDAGNLADAAADGLVEAGLEDQERGQRRENRTAGPGGHQHRDQVGERRGGGQPGDVRAGGTGGLEAREELTDHSQSN